MPHIHEKIDFTVEVFIVYKDKVLLRKHDKYKKWLSIGGHIELNEDPNQAALREVKEEVGLDVTLDASLLPKYKKDETIELIPPRYLNKNRISESHEHVTFVYFATTASNKVVEPDSHEKTDACKWFTKADLESDTEVIPNIKFYALSALALLGKST